VSGDFAPAGHGLSFTLPAPPISFVGRAEQLDWLLAAAGHDPTNVLGLSGPPGIGKTALAVAAAHVLAPGYPDAQLFIDLADVGPAPSPVDVMAQVIWSFIPEAELPDNPTKLAEAYRDLFKGRRALFVIDGMPSQPQWMTLALPQSCLLLVGGQGLPVQAELVLGHLPEADAVSLLLRLAPRIGPAAAELAALCGHLPLALRVAAAALSARSVFDTRSYLRRLLEEQDSALEMDPVLTTLAVSARLLPAETACLWRHLSVFPASFDAPAAAAVAEMKLEAAQTALNRLLDDSLLERDRGRYRMHAVARQAAARLLELAEREPARQRHAAYYCEVLAAANRPADDQSRASDQTAADVEGDGLLAGLRRFDMERANIVAGQAWAAAGVTANPLAARLASDYAAVGSRLLPWRQSPATRLSWLETARSAAQRLGDRDAEGSHLEQLGRFHRGRANPLPAISAYERRLRIARDSGERRVEGETLGRLGMTYIELGQPQRALEFLQQSLDIARELGDQREEALASWNLGLAHEELGDVANAIVAMQVCVDFERKVNHPDAESDAAHVDDLRRRIAR